MADVNEIMVPTSYIRAARLQEVPQNAFYRINKTVNVFCVGFLIYTLSWVVTTTTYADYILFQSFQVIGMLLFVPSAVKLIRWKFDDPYLKNMFTLYCIWMVVIVVRGFRFDYNSLKYELLDSYEGLFVYLVPFVMLFPRHPFFLKKMFNIIVILGFAYILYNILFIKDLLYIGANTTSQAIIEYFSKTLSVPCGFLLLTYMFHAPKRRLFAILILLFTFCFAAIRARRGLMFMCANIFLVAYFIYYHVHKMKLFVFLFSLLLFAGVYYQGVRVYNANRNGLLVYITERLNEGVTQTRDGVEKMFYKDMKTIDWVIGRGINGSYYCPGIDRKVHRMGIESDYLSLVLKGGLVSLALLLLIAVPAIFKGFFRSRNFLAKAAATWILFYLINLYPAPVTDFTLNYMLVWISIGICYSDYILNIPQNVMARILSP